ncbi:hypothetical protein QUB68_21315 [Microcoleus sp. A006_D1]|uniref:hypothetical protein n=1 Tax=Microcoleus sp. A006_D1 TaxID=3055267 RepID=UPI002FD264AC
MRPKIQSRFPDNCLDYSVCGANPRCCRADEYLSLRNYQKAIDKLAIHLQQKVILFEISDFSFKNWK